MPHCHPNLFEKYSPGGSTAFDAVRRICEIYRAIRHGVVQRGPENGVLRSTPNGPMPPGKWFTAPTDTVTTLQDLAARKNAREVIVSTAQDNFHLTHMSSTFRTIMKTIRLMWRQKLLCSSPANH
jgi:hypothetical protein